MWIKVLKTLGTRHLDTVVVGGSIPLAPTNKFNG